MTVQRSTRRGPGLSRGRRGPLLASVVALSALSVAACSNGSTGASPTVAGTGGGGASTAGGVCGTGKGNVAVWASSDSALDDLVKKFETTCPQYTVQYSKYSWDALDGKLVAAMAGGDAPDVSVAADMEVGQFSVLGGLTPLNDFYAAQNYQTSDFLPQSWEYFTTDDQMWAAPAYTDVRGLFYRKDILQQAGISEPPKTLDDLLADAKKISNGNDLFGFADQTGQLDVHVIAWLVYAFGGDFYSADHKTATVTSDAVINALQYYQSLYTEDAAPKDPAKRVDPWQGFKQGYYAMAHSGPWWLGLQKSEAPELASKWALAPLPDGPVSQTVYGHPNPWIVPTGAKNKEGAYAWLRFMLDPANQAQWFLATGLLPSTVAAYKDPQLANDPMVQQWLKLGQRPANSIHNVPNGQAITEAIYAMTGELKNGEDVHKAAEEANGKIQQLLDS